MTYRFRFSEDIGLTRSIRMHASWPCGYRVSERTMHIASGRTSVPVGHRFRQAHLADIGGEGACVNLIAGGAEAHQRGGNSLVVASTKPLYHAFERLPGLG